MQSIANPAPNQDALEEFREDIGLLRDQSNSTSRKVDQILISVVTYEPPPPYSAQSIVSVDELAAILAVVPRGHQQDMDWALVTDPRRNLLRQKRAAWLTKDFQFQSWLSSNSSDMLLVNAMETTWPMDVPSSTTYLISLLSQSLSSRKAALPLTFLCAMHANPGDYLEGPWGLLRSLSYQLVSQSSLNDSDLSFMDLQLLDGLRTYEISSLCDLFQRLLSTVGLQTWQPIFCLVDGISWFEDGMRQREMGGVMKSLREFVEFLKVNQADTGIILKVLVTSPTAVGFEAQGWLKGVREIKLLDVVLSEDVLDGDTLLG